MWNKPGKICLQSRQIWNLCHARHKKQEMRSNTISVLFSCLNFPDPARACLHSVGLELGWRPSNPSRFCTESFLPDFSKPAILADSADSPKPDLIARLSEG